MLDNLILEDQRKDIEKDYTSTIKRAKKGKLTISSDIDVIMNQLKGWYERSCIWKASY